MTRRRRESDKVGVRERGEDEKEGRGGMRGMEKEGKEERD